MKRLQVLTLLLSLTVTVLMMESCKKDDSCPTINCNTGTQNTETCACDCPTGFSGVNCQTEDQCITQSVVCQNGGTCVNGTCECPTGYIGANCESIDTAQIQALLDDDVTPKTLYDGGVTLDQLYGKMYKGGIIFYLNTTDGTGMVAATEDQSASAQWGCDGTDIMNLMNVTACPGMGNCLQPLPEDTFEGARIGDGKANTDAILAGCTTAGIAAKLCREIEEEWFLPSRGELNLMYTNLHSKGLGGFAAGTYWSSTEINNGAWLQIFYEGSLYPDVKGVKEHVRAARAF